MNEEKRRAIKLFLKSMFFTVAAITLLVIGFFSAEYFFADF